MLTNDEFPAGCHIHQLLWGDGVETSAAGISVVNGYDCKMVADTRTDAVVGAEGTLVNLGRKLVALRAESLLLS